MPSFLKQAIWRSPHYREMAHKHACQIRRAVGCRGEDTSTTVLAHLNTGRHGKGMGLKAHDAAGVYACYACHTWIDQGPAPWDEKQQAWVGALKRQRILLQSIIDSPTALPKDKEVAEQALARLPAA